MTTPDDRPVPDEARRAFILSMLQRMPESISQPLLADASIRGNLQLPVEDSLLLFGQRFGQAALLAALRDVADGKAASLTSISGGLSVERFTLEEEGAALLAIANQGARFPYAGLLSQDHDTRSRTLETLLAKEDLSADQEKALRASVADRPIEGNELADLESLIDATPKAFYGNMFAGAMAGSSYENFVPEDSSVFEALLLGTPPATLAGFRTAWLENIMALDPTRRARSIVLAAPLTVLRDGLVTAAAKTLPRDVRLELAKFLANLGDPFSQLAAFQLSAAEVADPEFRQVGDYLLVRLFDGSEQGIGKGLSFLSSALVLTATVSQRRRTLLDWPVYARRLAWYLHASLIVRTFGLRQLDVAQIEQMIGRRFLQNFRLIELCDARTAPHGLWSGPTPERLHAVIISRVVATLAAIGEEELPPEWAKARDAAIMLIAEGSNRLAYLAPAPFDPFEPDWGGLAQLPEQEAEEIIATMEANVDHARILSDLYNLALAFDLAPEQRQALGQHIPAFLRSLPDESFSTGTDLILQLAARWKMADLAEAVVDLSLPRAGTGKIVDLSAGPRFGLLGAASNSEVDDWARKAGEYMNGYAFALPAGPPIANMLAGLSLIFEFSPALAPSLASAKSFAMLVSEGDPESAAPAQRRDDESEEQVDPSDAAF